VHIEAPSHEGVGDIALNILEVGARLINYFPWLGKECPLSIRREAV